MRNGGTVEVAYVSPRMYGNAQRPCLQPVAGADPSKGSRTPVRGQTDKVGMLYSFARGAGSTLALASDRSPMIRNRAAPLQRPQATDYQTIRWSLLYSSPPIRRQ